MAFVLNSKIKIGEYTFAGGVNDLVIRKSVYAFVDTAILKIPGLGRIVSIKSTVNNALAIIGLAIQTPVKNMPISSVQTAKLFQEGDHVAIDLGYNGDMRNEFRGFVRRVNLTTPISIEMEGYAWQLRNYNVLASWKNTTLKEVLQRIIQGTDIVLSPDIPSVKLSNYYIHNRSGIDALQDLKERTRLTVYFDDNVLYAGLEEGRTTAPGTQGGLAEVVYNIGYNCVSNQSDLKQRLGKDNRVRVRLKSRKKDGTHTLYEAGDPGGAVYERTVSFIEDTTQLQNIANAVLKSLKYDGYEGKLLGFLQPYCKPGWKATIKDKKYEGARAGTYFVAGTEVSYGVRGARRKVNITYKLDNNTQLL